MCDAHPILGRIQQTQVIVVVRASKTNGLRTLSGELAALGLGVHEITLTTPGALDCIYDLRTHQEGLVVGAGTVLDAQTARDAIIAGAQFIVSPVLDRDVLRVAKEHGVVAIPGALTPSEAHEAWRAGADIVKVFPASVGGPSYIRALRGPFPDLRFLPTGGITVDNATDFLDAGAFAVCLGTSFVCKSALETGDFRQTLQEADRLVARLSHRRTMP
jgi:2-dehydro-3-deoxyphosphogluconate aldolase / (4S)-4-hydroxy-2-oxoglutarate aldolase